MRLLPVKDKPNPNHTSDAAAKSAKAARGDVKELLGKEFHVVKNGLDPEEVAGFLESVAGSSEAALKRLEHFAAMQKATQTMELMLTEARQLSEQLRTQSRLEAQAEKSQIISLARGEAEHIRDQAVQESARLMEEARKAFVTATSEAGAFLLDARGRMERMLDQTTKNYADIIDATRSGLHEAIARARETEEAGFRRAEEKATASTESMRHDIYAVVEETQNDLNAIFERLTRMAVGHADRSAVPGAGIEPADFALDAAPVELRAHGNGSGVVGAEGMNVAGVISGLAKDRTNENVYEGEIALVIPEAAGQPVVQQIKKKLLGMPAVRINMESGDDSGRTIMRLFLSQTVTIPAALLEVAGVADVQEMTGRETSGKGDHRRPTLPFPRLKNLMVTLTPAHE